MKIAIPLAHGRLAMHFGHCEQFALVDIDEATQERTRTEILPAPQHEPGLLPRWLHDRGAEVILAGGMGNRAQQLFAQQGIRVIYGVPPDTLDNVVKAFLGGSLVAGENFCDH